MTSLSKRKLGVYLLAIFLAGGGSGALIAWQICRRTPVAPVAAGGDRGAPARPLPVPARPDAGPGAEDQPDD